MKEELPQSLVGSRPSSRRRSGVSSAPAAHPPAVAAGRAPRSRAARRHCPVGAAGAATAIALLLGTARTAPAFAVSRNTTARSRSNSLGSRESTRTRSTASNARLRAMGVQGSRFGRLTRAGRQLLGARRGDVLSRSQAVTPGPGRCKHGDDPGSPRLGGADQTLGIAAWHTRRAGVKRSRRHRYVQVCSCMSSRPGCHSRSGHAGQRSRQTAAGAGSGSRGNSGSSGNSGNSGNERQQRQQRFAATAATAAARRPRAPVTSRAASRSRRGGRSRPRVRRALRRLRRRPAIPATRATPVAALATAVTAE